MKFINDVVPNYASDIKKRVAKSFGNGDITKQDFDKVCELLDQIIVILEKIRPDVKETKRPKHSSGKVVKENAKISKDSEERNSSTDAKS